MGQSTTRKTKKGRTYRSRGLSVPPDVDELIEQRIRSLGIRFSTYVIECVRRDLQAGGGFEILPAADRGANRAAGPSGRRT